MRLVFTLALGLCPLYGQVCTPSRILPADQVTGTFDQSNCRLPDGSAFAPYRLDLSARGKLQIETTGDTGIALILRNATGARLDSGLSIRRDLEAGTYLLLVTGGPGAFALRTTFTAEPGTWCSVFPSIGLNQAVSGRLGAAGCAAPDGSPYDAYSLATLGPGALNVSLSSSDFPATLILRDQDGHTLATDPAQLSVDLDPSSGYTIVVATSGSTGAYELVTAFQPLEDAGCRPLRSFDTSDSDASSLTADSCFVFLPDTGAPALFNYYQVAVSEAGMADLVASSADFLPTVSIFDNAGNLLATDTGAGGEEQSEIHLRVASGNYLVQVLSSIPTGGDYQFQYRITPGAPQACGTTVAPLNDKTSGTLSPSACRSLLGPSDAYRLTLPASGTLSLSLDAPGFTGRLSISDPAGDLLTSAFDSQNSGLTSFSADLAAGDYLVSISSDFGAGAYDWTPVFTAHAIPPCSFIPELDINGGYIQKLGPGSCRDQAGQPVDFYHFTLPSDSVVAAIMTSGQVDSFLSIVDSDGNVLRSDDNSYGLQSALMVQYLPAGSYQLAARAASSTPGGYYEVDLRTIAGPRPPFCSPRATLDPGVRVAGTLNFAACQYPDATFADIYQIVLDRDGTADLLLAGTGFDPALILLDTKGSVVAQGGADGHLTVDLTAGNYFAVAKPTGSYTSGGPYTLVWQYVQ